MSVRIIMTSNIGSLYLLDGIDDSGEIPEDARDKVLAELRGHFRPEFLIASTRPCSSSR